MTPHTLRRLAPVLLALAASLAMPGHAWARQVVVSGTIVDRVNGAAISGAQVIVSDSLQPFITGPDGRFAFRDLAPGQYLMRFLGAGYAERRDTLVVLRAGSIDVRVALTPTPYDLDPIAVEATPSPFLTRAGYYERRDDGFGGVFLDRAAIEKRRAAQFTQLFHEIPGAVVRSQSMGQRLVRFNRASGSRGPHPDGCIPDLYVDGLITGGRPGDPKITDHDVVDLRLIEAVEVYVGAITPIQYKSTCGVILVWTRHR